MAKKIYIINANYYEEISDRLVCGAINFLNENDISHEIVNVPGALEIPTVINLIHDKVNTKVDIGFIAVGCVIRGETSHYDYVCSESARALMQMSLDGLSIGYGILTCESKEQAIVRSSAEGLNKGKAATLACLRMIELKKEMY